MNVPSRAVTCISVVFLCACGSARSAPGSAAPDGARGGGTDGSTLSSGGLCSPSTCSQQGFSCGPAGDGCGGLLQCGACQSPETCGAGGTPSVCGNSNDGGACMPKTCSDMGYNCGPAGDGCGGMLACGSCSAPETCGGGAQPSVCAGIGDAGPGGDSSPDAATPAGDSGLPSALGWYEIPNTTYAPLCPSGQDGNCEGVVDAWNSGVADTKRNRLIFLGGGHSDYSGNEVYALDLSRLEMLRLNDPDSPNSTCSDVDPSGNPNARHTYGGLSYVASTDQVYMHGGALFPCGYGTVDTWTLTLSNLFWAAKDPLNGTPTTGSCCNYISFSDYDPVTDAVWYTDSADLWKYNAQTNTQTHLSEVSYLGYHQNCVVDYVARLFTCFGDSTVEQADMSAVTPTLVDVTSQTSGCSTLAGTIYPGLAYDPVQAKVVAWIGGSSVTLYDSVTKACTTRAFSGGPSSQSPNGTFNRWRYFPALGVFALVNDWHQNAFVLRMH